MPSHRDRPLRPSSLRARQPQNATTRSINRVNRARESFRDFFASRINPIRLEVSSNLSDNSSISRIQISSAQYTPQRVFLRILRIMRANSPSTRLNDIIPRMNLPFQSDQDIAIDSLTQAEGPIASRTRSRIQAENFREGLENFREGLENLNLSNFMGLSIQDIERSTSLSHIESSDQTCSICISNIHSWTRTLPCSHAFHYECIDQWLKDNNTCPTCRAIVSYG